MKKFLKEIEWKLRQTFFFLLKLIIRQKKINPADIKLTHIKTILIVRQHNELGDMLLTTPVFKALKKRFPKSSLILITRPVNYEIAKGIKEINEVLNYDSKEFLWQPWKFLTFINTLRKHNIDLSIVISTVSFSFTSALISYLSNAKIKIGGEVKGTIYKGVDTFFNIFLKVHAQNKHQVDVNLEYLKPLGIENVRDKKLCLSVNEELNEWAVNWLKKNNINKKDYLIGIHPGAGKTQNCWGAEKFAALCNYIITNYNVKLLVMCGSKETVLKENLINKLKVKFIELPLVSLLKLAAVIKQCRLFLCNDTGVLHVAAAVGTSTFAIFGQANPKYWNPPGKMHYSIWNIKGDITKITSEKVIKRIKQYKIIPEVFKRK